MVFDLIVVKDGADDEKEKYFIVMKAEDVIGICPSAPVTVSLKFECSSDEVQRLFPRGKRFTVKLEASWQRTLEPKPAEPKSPQEEPKITDATATVPEEAIAQ